MADPTPDPLPVPFPRSYWVVPGRLLAGAYPGHQEMAQASEKMARLLGTGVRAFVDLTEDGETNWRGEPFVAYASLARSLALERGVTVSWVRRPIPDQGVPSADRMTAILDEIDAMLAAGRPVYVHCWGGVGRTGTVVGCWLSRHGIAPGDEVLSLIQRLRSADPAAYRDSPETAEQRQMVTGWGRR